MLIPGEIEFQEEGKHDPEAAAFFMFQEVWLERSEQVAEFGETMGARSYGVFEAFILDHRTAAFVKNEMRSD